MLLRRPAHAVKDVSPGFTPVHVLVSLYNNTRSELMRYRDIQWHVTAYIVGLQGAFLVLIVNDRFRSLWSAFGRGIVTAILVALAGVGISLIWIFYGKFKEHRVRRATLDSMLGFREKGMFADGVGALLPEEKVGTNKIYPVLFTSLIGVMAFVTIYAAVKI